MQITRLKSVDAWIENHSAGFDFSGSSSNGTSNVIKQDITYSYLHAPVNELF